jgi:hypothetical protein
MQTNVMAIQSTDAFKGIKHLPGVNKNICLQTYIEDNPHFLTILYVIFWENIADTDSKNTPKNWATPVSLT